MITDKLFIIITVFVLMITPSAVADWTEEIMLYQTFEQVYNAWGIPESVFGQIYVWKNEGITLVAAFSERNHETDEIQATPNYFTDMLCYDYVLFNAEHTLISASQGAKTTASFILRTIQNNDTNESFHRYSTGYGYEEWGAISSDGYIVRWSSSQDIELYNCLESRWEWIWLPLISGEGGVVQC